MSHLFQCSRCSYLHWAWATFNITLVHVTPSNPVQTLPHFWRRWVPRSLDKVTDLEHSKTDFHMPCSYRICRSAGGRCWKAGRDFCLCPSLLCYSLPAWAVNQTLRLEVLPFQPAQWWSSSLPIPCIHRVHSTGCSPDMQPRWVCLDSSTPASSQWISDSFNLWLCVNYITWKMKESWRVFIWMTEHKEISSFYSHAQIFFFKHISKCLRYHYIMVKQGISRGHVILLVYRYMCAGG